MDGTRDKTDWKPMKKWTTLIIMLFAPLLVKAQDSSYLHILHKGDLFETPLPRMVVMDDRTFGQYYFFRVQFDSLRKKVIAFDYSFKRLEAMNNRKIQTLRRLIEEKDLQIEASRQAYLDMKATTETSMKQTRNCVDRFNGLQAKFNRQSRQNKVWQTATFILSGVIIIGVSL